MDFQNAATLTLLLVGLVALVKNTFPDLNPRVTPWVAVALGIGVTWLMAGTVWANEQVIGSQSLDKLGTEDKFVVGIALGLAATQLNRIFKVGANIGENNPSPPE